MNSLLSIENAKTSQILEKILCGNLRYKANSEVDFSIENLLFQISAHSVHLKSVVNYSLQPNEFFKKADSVQEEPRKISAKMIELS